MVPKVTSAGRSFKGAARYYLHDKKADTAERVAHVETLNLPTDDARRGVAHMIDTAVHAEELKRQAGLKGGRKLEKPVYTYTLTWHPSETPTQAEQMEAVRESLKALGMADRQAIAITHKDTDHPHVHVMVNRVCPETGRAVTTSNDRLKLSQWAEDYERRRGRVFCDERVKNNDARRGGEWRKDKSDNRKVWLEWKKAKTAELWGEHRAETANLRPVRKAQYEALWQQKDERFAQRRAEIKDLYKSIWRDVFKRQRQELKGFDDGLFKRIRYALSKDEGKAMAVVGAMIATGDLRQDFLRQQQQERDAIAERQKQTIRDSGREITKAWKYDRDALRASHKAEDENRYQDTRERSEAIWQATDCPQMDFEKAADQPEQKQAQGKPRRTAQEIMAEKRQRAKGRTRSRTRTPKR